MTYVHTETYVPTPILELIKILDQHNKGDYAFNMHCQDLIETILHKHCRFQEMPVPEDVDSIDLNLDTGEILFGREHPQSPNQNQ